MTDPLTEDELARLEEVARNEQRQYGDHVMIARRTVLSLLAALRATPVADTAGIDAELNREYWPALRRDMVKEMQARKYCPDCGTTFHEVVTLIDVALAAALRTPKPEGDR